MNIADLPRDQDGILHVVALSGGKDSTAKGADYGNLQGLRQRYPLREWGWGLTEVLAYNAAQGIEIPRRTDCASCFFQTIGEWWLLWRDHPEAYANAEALESKFGHTLRSPGRDTWPAALKDLRAEFEGGRMPRGMSPDTMRAATCRVCTL